MKNLSRYVFLFDDKIASEQVKYPPSHRSRRRGRTARKGKGEREGEELRDKEVRKREERRRRREGKWAEVGEE